MHAHAILYATQNIYIFTEWLIVIDCVIIITTTHSSDVTRSHRFVSFQRTVVLAVGWKFVKQNNDILRTLLNFPMYLLHI